MHDLFGAQMMDVFDLDNGDIDLRILEPPKKKPEEKPEQAASKDGKQEESKASAEDGSVTAKGESDRNEQPKKENFETK